MAACDLIYQAGCTFTATDAVSNVPPGSIVPGCASNVTRCPTENGVDPLNVYCPSRGADALIQRGSEVLKYSPSAKIMPPQKLLNGGAAGPPANMLMTVPVTIPVLS